MTELQLALLVSEPPEGTDWLHEQKLDGYRIVASGGGEDVTLLSRRFKDWTAQFPSIAEAVGALKVKSVVLDGEVCILMPDGRTSFQSLQNALGGEAKGALVYFVFDVLAIDGESLIAQPLIERKARLKTLLAKAPKVLKYCDHVEGNGAAFFAAACKAGLEGIISKKRDGAYLPGRGKSWVKTKCLLRQEFVIAGFTDPEGSRSGIGSLLLGVYDDAALVYAGKVGTGFSGKQLGEIRALLEPLERTTSPITPAPDRAMVGAGVHWCKPTLVCEVQFMEWTNDGRLRHPSFQGMRKDKLATDVVRERAVKAE